MTTRIGGRLALTGADGTVVGGDSVVGVPLVGVVAGAVVGVVLGGDVVGELLGVDPPTEATGRARTLT